MITEETIERMCKLVTSRQTVEIKDKGAVIAKLPLSDFCRLVHEDVKVDAIDLLEQIQAIVDQHMSDQRMVLGYSSVNDVVHWHVFDKSDPRYNLPASHIDASGKNMSEEVKSIRRMFINEERKRIREATPKSSRRTPGYYGGL
ncbi:MAG: hypothetical protein ACYDG3_10050 [Bacillati bacterium]